MKLVKLKNIKVSEQLEYEMLKLKHTRPEV